MTFVKRLVLGSVLILVLTVAILLWLAERSLRHDLESNIANSLQNEARLVAEALSQDSMAWQAQIHQLARQIRHRITLINRDGRVRADSDFPIGPLPAIENHGQRPEVRAALTTGRGQATRRSETVGIPFLYVAVPAGPGVVRVAASLDQIDEIVRRAQGAVARGALLALLIGSALAVAAGRSIAQPLSAISSVARAIAAGAPPRFPRSGIPDIDGLVQALRQMHRQLGDRFDQLRREQAETAALVESMVEGVIAADDGGRTVTANGAARRLLGYGLTGELPDLPELFRTKAAREVVDTVLRGQPVMDRELELDERAILMNARPLPSGGAVLVLHDLTDIRRLEAARRDFVANVSHELKTPLTSISGYAETLLTDSPDDATARRFLTTILDNARRMQRLVDDLLDLARIEAGRWQPEVEPVDLAAAAAAVWDKLGERATAQEVRFCVEVEPGAGTIPADPDALHQVLTNLIENSLRHTGRGGQILCRSRLHDNGFALSVTDNGSGIAHQHLARIFERFYRADHSRSRAEGGTGLGLAVVKHLVEAHGGQVSAQSERGAGTTVTCWFPAERDV
ncbi:MAG TPA: ATP-binding protein [Gemmatimonadales bacterium]|nr:ATP-binding protein [Gemmatimonadales bacterium]